MRVIFVLVAAVLGTGCTDPIVGSWEGKDRNACNERDEFEIDDELKGEGSLWGLDQGGNCTRCDFEVTLEDEGNDTYEGELDFENCECAGDRTADVECKLNDTADEVDCEIAWGACLRGSQDFEKQD